LPYWSYKFEINTGDNSHFGLIEIQYNGVSVLPILPRERRKSRRTHFPMTKRPLKENSEISFGFSMTTYRYFESKEKENNYVINVINVFITLDTVSYDL